MAGFLDPVLAMMGHPDPMQQLLAAYNSGGGGPPGGPPSVPAGGGAPAGPPTSGAPPQGPAMLPGGVGDPNARPTPINYTTTPEQQAMNLRLANPTGAAAAAAAPAQGGPSAAAPPPMPGYQPSQLTPEMILQMYNRNQAYNQLFGGINQMAAGLYPGRSRGLGGGGGGGGAAGGQDPGAVMESIMRLQQYNQGQAQAKYLWDNAEAIGKPYGMSGDQVRTLQMTGELPQVLGMQAGVGNPAYAAQLRAERALTTAGKPIPWTPGDPDSHAAYQAAQVAESKNTQAQIDAGREDAPVAVPAAQRQVDAFKWLDDHPEATAYAIEHPTATSFQAGLANWGLGNSQKEQDAATAQSYLTQAGSGLFAGEFKGTRNLRNLTEANKLAGSTSRILSSGMPADQAAIEIKTQLANANRILANAKAQGGGQLTPAEWAAADALYKTGGKYNAGATQMKTTPLPATAADATGAPATPQTMEDVQKLDAGTKFVVPYGPSKGQIGTR